MKQWINGNIIEVADEPMPQTEEPTIQVTQSELEQLIYEKICLILGVE